MENHNENMVVGEAAFSMLFEQVKRTEESIAVDTVKHMATCSLPYQMISYI